MCLYLLGSRLGHPQQRGDAPVPLHPAAARGGGGGGGGGALLRHLLQLPVVAHKPCNMANMLIWCHGLTTNNQLSRSRNYLAAICQLLSVSCQLTGDEDADDGEKGEQHEEDGEAGGGEADAVHDLLGHDAALRS